MRQEPDHIASQALLKRKRLQTDSSRIISLARNPPFAIRTMADKGASPAQNAF